jgi:hypothetical protein
MRRLAPVLVLLLVPAIALGGKTTTAGDQSLKIVAGVNPAKASKPGKPRRVGLRIVVRYLSLNEGAQISEQTKSVLTTLPPGMRSRTKAFETCLLSELNAADTADPATAETACPQGSIVGTGTATADARPALPDPVPAVVTLYNGIDDVNVDGTPRVPGTPAVILFAKTTLGLNSILPFDIDGNRLLLEFSPPTPGVPEIFHIQDVDLTFPRSLGFVTAPHQCVGGRWRFSQTIENFDGPSVTARHTVPCKKAG